MPQTSQPIEEPSNHAANFGLEPLGAGIGLRTDHYDAILDDKPAVRWFEVIPENYIGRGGYMRRSLAQVAERYRLVAHGVGLSIGSTDPLDMDHLASIKAFCDEIDSPWFSDHLCFTMVDHVNLNDLIPLPFTEEAIKHVAARVKQVQEMLERPFLLENVTYYMAPATDEMTEAEFLTALLGEADCGLLLDVANVVLNAKNHGAYTPEQFFDAIPMHRVGQMHLAGHEAYGDVLLDTHAAPVNEETWAAFRAAVKRTGPTSVLIERDNEIPPLADLLAEADEAQRHMDEAVAERR